VWEAVVLSFGLAMDATAVSAARGMAGHRARELVILPAIFGGFQSGMAALGWLAGNWAGQYIAAYQHWIAFGLLTAIGGKMIFEALRGGDDKRQPGTAAVYIGLALATSIDAAAAGLTLPLLAIAPWLALVLIGAITAACSALGYLAGTKLGGIAKLEVLGGVAILAIGVRLLIQGL
jgi:manganese efflux pump family protein